LIVQVRSLEGKERDAARTAQEARTMALDMQTK
jgi:hypothetical protein